LAVEHFLTVETGDPQNQNPTFPGRRLNNYDFTNGVNPPKPTNGYFEIVSPSSLVEGTDSDGFMSTRAPNGNLFHTLRFTSVQPFGTGTPPYTTTVGTTVLTSRAAEIAYFLGSTNGAGIAASATPTGVPLFNLYRQQRLVAMTAEDQTNLAAAGLDAEVLSTDSPTTPTKVNTMLDLATQADITKRVQMIPYANRFAQDVLLTNVISFEVKPTWPAGPQGAATGPTTFASSTDHPYDNLTVTGNTTFDTAQFMSSPGTSSMPPAWAQGTSYAAGKQVVNRGVIYTCATAGTSFNGSGFGSPNGPTGIGAAIQDGSATWNFTQTLIRVTGLQIRVRVYDPKVQAARQITLAYDQ
jgi:hypothetical protein